MYLRLLQIRINLVSIGKYLSFYPLLVLQLLCLSNPVFLWNWGGGLVYNPLIDAVLVRLPEKFLCLIFLTFYKCLCVRMLFLSLCSCLIYLVLNHMALFNLALRLYQDIVFNWYMTHSSILYSQIFIWALFIPHYGLLWTHWVSA